MGRPHRIVPPDSKWHVFARGNDRRAIFRTDADRLLYLRLLGRMCDESNVQCQAFCLMTNHVHLLLETPEGNLSDLIHRLHGAYVRRFNKTYSRTGHLFERRFGSEQITTDLQAVTVARYIARNPVEAGLCRKAEDWPWSSCRHANGTPAPPWLDLDGLLVPFGGNSEQSRADYLALANHGP